MDILISYVLIYYFERKDKLPLDLISILFVLVLANMAAAAILSIVMPAILGVFFYPKSYYFLLIQLATVFLLFKLWLHKSLKLSLIYSAIVAMVFGVLHFVDLPYKYISVELAEYSLAYLNSVYSG